jgi:hypothetical protein
MIFEGWLIKEGGSAIKNWKKRWHILNGTLKNLAYYEKKDDFKNKVEPKGIVNIEGATIVEIEKSKKKKDFCFCVMNNNKPFYACCDNDADYKKWLEKLRAVFYIFNNFTIC